MEQDTKTAKKKRIALPAKEVIYARDRIKPRGLCGLYKGKIFYDKDADIFNLGL
jgi:hypothetical protein